MKKLLLGTAAVVVGFAAATPAMADGHGVKLGLGGHMKGYMAYTDQDTTPATEERDLDIFRETEIHFTGETTLDNGLTVGFHAEADADGADGFGLDESYAYFSGAWGRVNFGEEDGAAYLLQVAAPSADSNVDGIRQFIATTNYALTTVPGAVTARLAADGLDYDNSATKNDEKLTYLTPVFNGFQFGVSYTPDVATGSLTTNQSGSTTNTLGSANSDDVVGAYGEAYEGAARYEGQWDNVGITLGGGYTHVELEGDNATEDDFQEWNVGLDLDWSAFGLGVVYTENDNGLDATDENETWVVGADYTTGPFKLGVSYLNNDTDVAGAATEVETDRVTGGVIYTYGPGMTFRGSVSYVDHQVEGAADVDSTSFLLGTQINF